MKWFFAANEVSLNNSNFSKVLKVSVLSALHKTDLEPHFIYQGNEHPFLDWLRKQRVIIHNHQLSFHKPDLDRRFDLSGAWLRLDIPPLVREKGFQDKFVLYTDCDVLFLKQIGLGKTYPEFFSAAPQFNKNYSYINSGVMLMNIDRLLETYPAFRTFVVDNYNKLSLNDQVAYNLFYNGKWDKLPLENNWKTYWGINPNARIVHFHGPKHTYFEDLLDKNSYFYSTFNKKTTLVYLRLALRNVRGLYYYVGKAREYLNEPIPPLGFSEFISMNRKIIFLIFYLYFLKAQSKFKGKSMKN